VVKKLSHKWELKVLIGKGKRITYSANMAKAIASQGIYVEFSLILKAFSVQDR
jgi:hypothetical protein